MVFFLKLDSHWALTMRQKRWVYLIQWLGDWVHIPITDTKAFMHYYETKKLRTLLLGFQTFFEGCFWDLYFWLAALFLTASDRWLSASQHYVIICFVSLWQRRLTVQSFKTCYLHELERELFTRLPKMVHIKKVHISF